jgi:hypothetical protein
MSNPKREEPPHLKQLPMTWQRPDSKYRAIPRAAPNSFPIDGAEKQGLAGRR